MIQSRDYMLRGIFFNLSAIELKLYRQFRTGEAHILTMFDDCRIIMSGFRTIPGSKSGLRSVET